MHNLRAINHRTPNKRMLSDWFDMGFPRPEHHETKRVSDKIKWCKSKIKELGDAVRLGTLDKDLDKAMNLLDKRNKLVHGQICFASTAPGKIIPSKKGEKERLILPKEAYDLAEDMYYLHIRILNENAFKLVASLRGRMDA